MRFHSSCASTFFFFNDTATTEIYTLSLHDALPISRMRCYWWWLNGNTTEADSGTIDRKSTRLNSSHLVISYAVFCLKKITKRIILDRKDVMLDARSAEDGCAVKS